MQSSHTFQEVAERLIQIASENGADVIDELIIHPKYAHALMLQVGIMWGFTDGPFGRYMADSGRSHAVWIRLIKPPAFHGSEADGAVRTVHLPGQVGVHEGLFFFSFEKGVAQR